MRRVLLTHNTETGEVKIDITGFNNDLTREDVISYVATLAGFFGAGEQEFLDAMDMVDRARAIIAQQQATKENEVKEDDLQVSDLPTEQVP